jgi:hypothetical protein
MSTPVRTLAIAAAPGGDAIGSARRGATFALVAAVLTGSAGIALAAAALAANAWAVWLVVAATVLGGAVLAATAWRTGFR